MPESITVAGITLKLASFAERARSYRGEEGRAFDHSLHVGTDAPKRTWDGETIPYPFATETALRVATEAGPVECDGLVLNGDTVTARVRVEGSQRGPDVQGPHPDYAAINVTLSLSFVEA